MTSLVKKRIAQIRHGQMPKGFVKTILGLVPDAWHKFRIDEICRLSSGSTPRRDKAGNFKGNILWVTSGELKAKFVDDTKEKVTLSAARESRLELYEPGTVVAAIYGLEAAGIRGTASIIKKRCTISQACMAFSGFKGVDNEFFYYWYLQNGPLIGIRFAQGTKQQNLSSEIIGSLHIFFPPLAEQRQIAKILAAQDRMIELLNRKIEQMKLLEKYYLRKMFPRHGKNVPEVRFPGFNGAWERQQLGEFVSFSKGTGYSKADLKETGTPIILYGRLYTKHEMEVVDVDTFAKAKPGSVYSHGDEVIVPASGETAEDIAIASVVKQSGVLLGGDINILTSCSYVNPYFLALSLSGGSAHSDVIRRAQGKSVVHLHQADLRKVILAYPTLSEQMRISDFFRHLDNLVAQNQRKHDEEVRKKKALMQLLLAGIVRVGEAASSRLNVGKRKRLPAAWESGIKRHDAAFPQGQRHKEGTCP